jgi:hypothetical protein
LDELGYPAGEKNAYAPETGRNNTRLKEIVFEMRIPPQSVVRRSASTKVEERCAFSQRVEE